MRRMTPAQRHFARAMAAESAAIAAAATAPTGANDGPRSAYELKRAELDADLQGLKLIQAIDGKLARKRELIANYDAWIAGVLDANRDTGSFAQDDVLLTMMMWAIDIEDYDRALPMVEYVLRGDLKLPERFTRTAPTFIAEESAVAALKHIGQNEDANLTWLQLIEEQTREGDMLDIVRAKLHKAIGLQLLRMASADDDNRSGPAGGRKAAAVEAERQLREALRRHEGAGVKKDLQRAESLVAKLST